VRGSCEIRPHPPLPHEAGEGNAHLRSNEFSIFSLVFLRAYSHDKAPHEKRKRNQNKNK
jgi:hypothetical protein